MSFLLGRDILRSCSRASGAPSAAGTCHSAPRTRRIPASIARRARRSSRPTHARSFERPPRRRDGTAAPRSSCSPWSLSAWCSAWRRSFSHRPHHRSPLLARRRCRVRCGGSSISSTRGGGCAEDHPGRRRSDGVTHPRERWPFRRMARSSHHRQRRRHGRGHDGADLRAVLHHEATWFVSASSMRPILPKRPAPPDLAAGRRRAPWKLSCATRAPAARSASPRRDRSRRRRRMPRASRNTGAFGSYRSSHRKSDLHAEWLSRNALPLDVIATCISTWLSSRVTATKPLASASSHTGNRGQEVRHASIVSR
jgi:hypothetical protein